MADMQTPQAKGATSTAVPTPSVDATPVVPAKETYLVNDPKQDGVVAVQAATPQDAINQFKATKEQK